MSAYPTMQLPCPPKARPAIVDIGPLTLESGAVLDDVSIAVQRWGELSPNRDNVVMVLHALTGDSHVTGPAGPGHPTPGWWDGVAGPGAPIDTDQVVCDRHQRAGRLPGFHRTEFACPRRQTVGLEVPAGLGPGSGARRHRRAGRTRHHRGGRRDRRLDGRRPGTRVACRPPRVRAGRAGAGRRGAGDRRPDRHPEHADRGHQGRPGLAGRRLPRHRPGTRCRPADRAPVRAPDLPRRGRTRHPVRQRRPGRRGTARPAAATPCRAIWNTRAPSCWPGSTPAATSR